MNGTIQDHALNYASAFQWAVFACHAITAAGGCTCGNPNCRSQGKHPRTPHGVLDATADPEEVGRQFAGGASNIGIATGSVSQLVVIDVDEAKGANLNDLLIGGLDESVFATATVRTGGGLHLYYWQPQGIEIRNSASKLGKFIDVRGEGGYVIAPPSVHISGSRYEWLNADEAISLEMLEMPQQWIDVLHAPAEKPLPKSETNGNRVSQPLIVPVYTPGVVLPEKIAEGARNTELTRVAGSLRYSGLSEGAMFAALAIENQRLCKPPLEDVEVHAIARSVGRYKTHNAFSVVEEGESKGRYENTLRPYLFGEFMATKFEVKEILGFHIGARDIAIIQAATNAGKTTLLRNVGLCMAAGREFLPFFDGCRPIRMAYFDFENDDQDIQRDLRDMAKVFTPEEMQRLNDNFIIIPKGMMDGEMMQFNRHEKWVNELLVLNGVEFAMIDNISAAYDLNDENSNAEVTRKIIKPLLKMAYTSECAFLFAHHYGKAKQELESAGVHAGRGASALQALSRTVINLFGDVSKGEPITVECAKRKTDGGKNYREAFELGDDRWFHTTTLVPPACRPTAYSSVMDFMQASAGDVHIKGVTEAFRGKYGPDSVAKALGKLVKEGYLLRDKIGLYRWNDWGESGSEDAEYWYEK